MRRARFLIPFEEELEVSPRSLAGRRQGVEGGQERDDR